MRSRLLALGALLCNAVFFVNPPGQRAVVWLSVVLAGVSLIFLIRGLKRAFGQPRVYRGKILSSILALVSLLLVGVAIFSPPTALGSYLAADANPSCEPGGSRD